MIAWHDDEVRAAGWYEPRPAALSSAAGSTLAATEEEHMYDPIPEPVEFVDAPIVDEEEPDEEPEPNQLNGGGGR